MRRGALPVCVPAVVRLRTGATYVAERLEPHAGRLEAVARRRITLADGVRYLELERHAWTWLEVRDVRPLRDRELGELLT